MRARHRDRPRRRREAGHPSYADVVGAATAEEPPRDVDEDSTAWLLYTSGTTGFPKGAMLTHRNLTVAVLESVIEYEPQPDERNLVAFPLCHVAGYTVPVTHMRGGRIVLTPMFEPELWMQLVDEHGITGTALAPTMLNMVLQHPKHRRLPPRRRCAASATARRRCRSRCCAPRSSGSGRSCTRASG